MVKIKKRYLLIAIVTAVAMICSGLSLILSANTNISISPNVNVTVKADEIWDEWTPVGQGDFGAFHYEAKADKNSTMRCMIFTGSGALDLTHCSLSWTEDYHYYATGCTVSTSEDLEEFHADYLVVGEGITSVTLEGSFYGINLSSTVASLSFVVDNSFLQERVTPISVRTDENGNFALQQVNRNIISDITAQDWYDCDMYMNNIDEELESEFPLGIGINGTCTTSDYENYTCSGDCMFYLPVTIKTPVETVKRTILLGCITEDENYVPEEMTSLWASLTSITLRDDCIFVVTGAILPANVLSITLPNSDVPVVKDTTAEEGHEWDAFYAYAVNNIPVPRPTPETGVVLDLSLTIGAIVLLGAVLVVLNKKTIEQN